MQRRITLDTVDWTLLGFLASAHDVLIESRCDTLRNLVTLVKMRPMSVV